MNIEFKIEQARGLREILRFRRDPLAYVGDVSRRSVDIRHITLDQRNVFLVNHPELIRDVLVTHDWNFIKGPGLKASKPVLGDGLLTSEGELHRRQRRLAQPGFNHDRLGQYAKYMANCAERTASSWNDGEEYAINEEMMRLTLNIVTRCLFSTDIGKEAAKVGDALTEVLHLFNALVLPIAQRFTMVRKLVERRAASSRRRLDAVLQRIIHEHRVQPGKFDDMLSMLMGAQDEGSATYMSEALLRDEAMTLFLAGHETTANALTWTWYLLAQNPAVEERMAEEIDAELAGRLPKLEDLARLRYTAQVFRESLRLYPPAWIVTRQAVTDYQLGAVKVPAAALLFLSPFATHRDPRFWNAPEVFQPERWNDVSVEARPKFAYFPFGAGTRVCIGEHFAMMEGVLVLAMIAQRWRLHLAPGQKVELWPQITLRPKYPMRFRVDLRSTTLRKPASEQLDLYGCTLK